MLIDGSCTDYNEVAANYIGVDSTGENALGNGGNGVSILDGAFFNTIGASGEGNVISSNVGDGVLIDGTGTETNMVAANFIGLDATGEKALGNGGNGVSILDGAFYNTVGYTINGGAATSSPPTAATACFSTAPGQTTM